MVGLEPTSLSAADFHTTIVFTTSFRCLWSGLCLNLIGVNKSPTQVFPIQSLHLPFYKGLARRWHFRFVYSLSRNHEQKILKKRSPNLRKFTKQRYDVSLSCSLLFYRLSIACYALVWVSSAFIGCYPTHRLYQLSLRCAFFEVCYQLYNYSRLPSIFSVLFKKVKSAEFTNFSTPALFSMLLTHKFLNQPKLQY